MLVKLIHKPFDDVRVMVILIILTKSDTTNAVDALKKIAVPEGNVKLLDVYGVSKEYVKEHVNLFWADVTFGDATNTVNDATLNGDRNATRMKSITIGKKIWNSLTSKFQNEITGYNK